MIILSKSDIALLNKRTINMCVYVCYVCVV